MLTKLSKAELLLKCEELKITKYKSKNKSELINLINIKNSKLYGNNGDMHENFDHQSLFNLLKLQKNWIITYNNCDYIKKLNYILYII